MCRLGVCLCVSTRLCRACVSTCVCVSVCVSPHLDVVEAVGLIGRVCVSLSASGGGFFVCVGH